MQGLHRMAMTLQKVEVEYVLIGGHAVNLRLEPRITADVDAAVEVSAPEWARVEAAFAREGFILDAKFGGSSAAGPDFVRFVHPQEPMTLELLTAKTAYQRLVISRRVSRDGIHYATVEDLIILMLIADRPKDQVDLMSLTRIQDLEWPYIEALGMTRNDTPSLRSLFSDSLLG
jgi:hypothetical protein